MTTDTMPLRNRVVAAVLSSPKLFDWATRQRVCVFLYHDVSSTPSPFYASGGLNVRPELFERQIQIIKRHFHVIAPSDLLTGDYPRPAALITFDDGTHGYFETALPIMRRLDCPSIVFLNMGAVDGEPLWAGLVSYLLENSHAFREFLAAKRPVEGPLTHAAIARSDVDEFLAGESLEDIERNAREFVGPLGTRAELRAAESGGYCYLGNHLYNHYVAANLTDAELEAAFQENRTLLRQYSNSVELFSYPFGQPGVSYDARTNDVLTRLGARFLFSAYPALNRGSERLQHRIAMTDRTESAEELRAWVVMYRLLGLRPAKWLWELRRAAG